MLGKTLELTGRSEQARQYLELTGRSEQARQYYALAGHLTPAYAVSCRTWGGETTPADATCAMEPVTPAGS